MPAQLKIDSDPVPGRNAPGAANGGALSSAPRRRGDCRNRAVYWTSRAVPGISVMRVEFSSDGAAPSRRVVLATARMDVAGGSEARDFPPARGQRLLLVYPGYDWTGPSSPSASGTDAAWIEGDRPGEPVIEGLLDPNRGSLSRKLADLHGLLNGDDDPRRLEELFVSAVRSLVGRDGSGCVRREQPPSDHVLVSRALDWMRRHHDQPVLLEEIAAAFGISQFRLIRLFNRTLGLTPHACLVRIRLGVACDLLRRGVPPAEAAAAAGFYDQSALGWHFKRSLGLTPGQFARAASS